MTKRLLSDKQVEEIKKLLRSKSAYAVAKETNIHVRIISEIKNGIYVNTVEPKKKGGPRNHDPSKKQERKFSDKQIRQIREQLLFKKNIASIAREFKCNAQTIRDIRDGYTYKDVR